MGAKRNEQSEKAKMLAGELYDASDPELAEARRTCRRRLERYNASSVDDGGRRRTALVELLGTAGQPLLIEPPFHCDYGFNISIGDRCEFNFGVVILDCASVTIGDAVLVGPGVKILTAGHPIEPEVRQGGLEWAKPVVIEDGVWLGADAIVNPGVTVGAGSVVGSGAVVTRDVPSNVVVAGNPARILREI